MRIGLIGAGRHGSRYARHIVSDLDETSLVGLCRRDAEAGRRQAAELGCPFYPSAAELVAAPEVDAVVLVVPPSHHEELCGLAARAGKPILVEKPLAVSCEAARRIRSVLERHPVPFMVAHTLRYNPVVLAMRDAVESLGPINGLNLSQRFEPTSLAWLDEPALSGGGIIIHTGVHSFDLVRLLGGAEVEAVSCRASRSVTRNTEDNFLAQLELANGALASVMGSRSTESRNGLIEVVGRRGQLTGDHVHGVAWRIAGRERLPLELRAESRTVLLCLRAFVEAVEYGHVMPIRWEDGYAAITIAEACYRSVAEGGRSVLVAHDITG